MSFIEKTCCRGNVQPLKSEIRDGMAIDWDMPAIMDDGLVLRCDVFRPIKPGRYPTILSYGPYGKWMSFQEGYSTAWDIMIKTYPDAGLGSSNKYQAWEVCDPEKWVPNNYVCARFDSRGAGRSPGFIDHFSPREAQDIYRCIEWAAEQPWSNGKIGMSGISYYAVNQWMVAALQPPHLAAICIWEGLGDNYRDADYHGGILNTMPENWWDMQIRHIQHGWGSRGLRHAITGELAAGPETLSEEQLQANRRPYRDDIYAHPLCDAWHRDRSAQWDKIKVPLLSCGNWGGQGLHTRGNVEGFMQAASSEKWLEMHGGEHWAGYYTDAGIALQKRFFDYYLKGEPNGWDEVPRVNLKIRHPGEKFVERTEHEWPIARTEYRKLFLDTDGLRLRAAPPPSGAHQASYGGFSDGLTFITDPLEVATEITGHTMVRLFVSSETQDADLFLVLRIFAPDFKEVVFKGALDPNTPVGQGWLRASHRQLDLVKSTFFKPYHTHDERQWLKPGEVYPLDIEILPTSIVAPVGYRIGLSIRGRDYVYPGGGGSRLSNMKNAFTGCGPFLHDNGRDRPPEIFGGKVTVHTSKDQPSYLQLPIVPPKG